MFTSSRKYFCLAIFIVALTFPHISQGFSLNLGGGEGAVTKPAAQPKRFKFHKIERVAVPDDELDEEEEGCENEGDDGGEYGGPSEKTERTIFRARVEEAEREATKPSKPWFWSSLFSWGNDAPATEPPKPVETKTNGIINWIQSFRTTTKDEPKPIVEEQFSLMSYFDRWPFNALFPSGKPQKPIYMPKRGGAPTLSAEPMSQEHFESLLHTVPGFVVNASHVSDIECRQQMQIFHHQLRGHKLWTLQMLDSTAKFTTGMLRGNINQFGDFDLCTHIRTVVKVTPKVPLRIKGKYCLAHIETQAAIEELRVPVYMAHGRELWNSHLGNPSHFVPRYSVANWGVCVPNLCPASVVREMIETNLRPYNTTGVNFRIEVNENDCFVRQSRKLGSVFKKDRYVGFTIGYIAIFIVIVNTNFILDNMENIKKIVKKITIFILRAFQEVSQKLLKATESTESEEKTEDQATEEEEPKEEEKNEPEEEVAVEEEHEEGGEEAAEEEVGESGPSSLHDILTQIFESFSPRRTFSELTSLDKSDLQFPLFHGLRILATVMIYLCLKYIMLGHLPIVNRDKLVKTMDQPFSILFRSPMIYMDVLLIINGFLSAYHTAEEMEQKSHIFVLKRITGKFLRYLPTLYAVLFFQTWILPHLGSGPLWGSLVMQNSHLCEQNMWRNFFGVQNAVDFEETCSPMSTQLALELQLFILAPLIVWLYYTDADAAFLVYGVIHAMSVAARFSRTNRELLSSTIFHGMNVSKFYRTANIMFSSPISRATPYLIGIGAAILYRSTEGVIEMSAVTRKLCWVTAASGIFWCFWDQSFGTRVDFVYNSADAASYASWAPLILGFCLVIVIFLIPKEESLVNDVLTRKPLLFLSRISFPVQLVSFVVIVYRTAEVKESLKFSIGHMVDLQEIMYILIISLALSFFIDVPMQNVRKILVNRFFSEKLSHPVEEEAHDDEEHLEEEPSDAATEESKPKTPEPGDDIWGSDPEEEEQKYLTKRNSIVNGNGGVDLGINPEVENDSHTESDLDTTITKSNEDEEKPNAAKVDEEEEEETEITEEEEVKRRPETPEAEPAPERPIYRRRRLNATDE